MPMVVYNKTMPFNTSEAAFAAGHEIVLDLKNEDLLI